MVRSRGRPPVLRSRWASGVVCALVCALALLVTAAVRADEPMAEARLSFERGVAHADRGELDAAIEAFELAYRASPHPAVLFNLGQAYSAGGRPVDAVRTLRAYLRDAAPTGARKEQTEALLRFNEARVGRVVLHVEPESAEVLVDGRSLGVAQALSTLELEAGDHVLSARAEGFVAASLELRIRPWQTPESAVSLVLEPRAEPQGETGRLELQRVPASAHATIDGAPYRGDALSVGPHWLELTHAGYEPWHERVTITRDGVTKVRAVLARADSCDAGCKAQRRERRAWAWATGSVGVALEATAVTLYLVSSRRYDDWRNRSDRQDVVDAAVAIQRYDDAAVGCAVAGGVLLASAITLTLLSWRKPADSSTKGRVMRAGRSLLNGTRW